MNNNDILFSLGIMFALMSTLTLGCYLGYVLGHIEGSRNKKNPIVIKSLPYN